MTDFKYRPDVDGLRAVAVMLVVLFHAGLGCSGGFVGVDVFFVISGFLITGLILKQQRTGNFRLKDFWLRRIRRIVPASVCVVIATLLLARFILWPDATEELAKSAIAHQLMLANFFFWKESGYFAGTAELKPLLHMWSLAVEEQFYLFYPLLLVFLRRYPNRVRFTSLFLLSLASFTLSVWGVSNYPSATYFLLPSRAWELLLGGLLWGVPQPKFDRSWTLNLLSVTSLGAIMIAGCCYTSATPFPGSAALLPCAGAALLIYTNTKKLTWVGRVLASRPLVFVGLLSYSLYLWHWPLLAFARNMQGGNLSTTLGVLIVGASFGLALISWRFVETPFRKKSVLSDTPRLITATMTVATLIIVSAAVIDVNEGFPQKPDPRIQNYQSAKRERIYHQRVTIEQLQQGNLPTLGTKEGPVTCLLWGDSHAMSLAPGIDATCRNLGLRVYQVTYVGTPPMLDFVFFKPQGKNEKNYAFSRAVVDFVAENDIELVILAAYWLMYDGEAKFEESLTKTVRELTATGTRVVIVRDVADLEFDVPDALAQAVLDGKDVNKIGITLDKHRQNNIICDAAISKQADQGATILDPAPLFLDEHDFWHVEFDGQPMYFDNAHLTTQGGLHLQPMFEELFRDIGLRSASRAKPIQ